MTHSSEVSRAGLDKPAVAATPAVADVVRDDRDMFDSPQDLARWPALVDRLRRSQDLIGQAFRAADSAAEEHQREHRQLTIMAACFGTGAVLFAIVQLANPELLGGRALVVAEVVAAGAAFAAFVMGVYTGRQSRWLLERHKAECLRLAKFRFLTDPITWNETPDALEARVSALREEVEAIRAITRRQFRELDGAGGRATRAPVTPGPAGG